MLHCVSWCNCALKAMSVGLSSPLLKHSLEWPQHFNFQCTGDCLQLYWLLECIDFTPALLLIALLWLFLLCKNLFDLLLSCFITFVSIVIILKCFGIGSVTLSNEQDAFQRQERQSKQHMNLLLFNFHTIWNKAKCGAAPKWMCHWACMFVLYLLLTVLFTATLVKPQVWHI